MPVFGGKFQQGCRLGLSTALVGRTPTLRPSSMDRLRSRRQRTIHFPLAQAALPATHQWLMTTGWSNR